MSRSKVRFLRLLGAVMIVGALSAAPGSTRSTFADESMIHMVGDCSNYECEYSFFPDDITLPAGSAISFMNLSSTTHTATSDSGAFDTGNLAPGGILRIVFNSPGTFLFHCTIHPSMQGRIIITGSGPTATVPVATSTATTPAATPIATPTASETATAAPAATPTATAVTPAKLTLAAHFVPKTVHAGQSVRLQVRTMAKAQLSIAVTRPGASSMKRSVQADEQGGYRLKIAIGAKSHSGSVVARITASLAEQSVRSTARATVR